jgi:hypothetical protein
MTAAQTELFNSLQDQADNKVSVYVQEGDPSWTDANSNHAGDRWYIPSVRKWYRYNGYGWYEVDDSILSIENYAKGKTTYHYGSALPGSSLGEVGDFYFRSDSGQIIQYRKTGETTWTKISEYGDGADKTQSALDAGASLDFTYVKGDTLLAGDQIRTDLITVDTAQIVNGAIKYAKIGTAEIDTLLLADEATTFHDGAALASSLSDIDAATWVDIGVTVDSLDLTTGHIVMVSAYVTLNSTHSSEQELRAAIYRTTSLGASQRASALAGVPANLSTSLSLLVTEDAYSSVTDYHIRVRSAQAGTDVISAGIQITEIKR